MSRRKQHPGNSGVSAAKEAAHQRAVAIVDVCDDQGMPHLIPGFLRSRATAEEVRVHLVRIVHHSWDRGTDPEDVVVELRA